LGETASLLAKIRANPVSEILEKYHQTTMELQSAFESMRTPWLDGQNAIRSAHFLLRNTVAFAAGDKMANGDRLA
jgi:hypothetical protein